MYKVTNGNKDKFIGRYDGVDFEFPAGKSVYCPDDACKHIFGLGDHNKDQILLRNGWLRAGGLRQDGMAILNAFIFELAQPIYDAPLAQVVHEPALVVDGAGATKASAGRAPAAFP